MIKQIKGNWKFSCGLLILLVIFNIVFLRQPTFGKYTGTIIYNSYYGSESYHTEIDFKGGCVCVAFTKQGVTAYEAGIYQKVEDKIVLITFYTNPTYQQETHKRIYTRDSVFALSSGETVFTSTSAILLQIALSIVELIVFSRFVWQFATRNKVSSESTSESSCST
jgi:hypothetical protein